MGKLGFSPQKPLTCVVKQKRELVKVWLERDLARIKKSRRLCADDRRALSMAVALTLSDKIYERHFDGAIRSEQIIGTLNHLHGHVRGQIILIWDRVRIHISKKVQGYLSEHPEIHIELLPAYTPEFNPEEYGHDNVKQHLRNARPSNKNEIHLMLDHGFAHLRRQPDLLLSFFHATGLSVRQLWLT